MGNIIKINGFYNLVFFLRNLQKNTAKLPLLTVFVEIDMYRNSLVIIKNFNDLSKEDFYSLIQENYNIKSFKYLY